MGTVGGRLSVTSQEKIFRIRHMGRNNNMKQINTRERGTKTKLQHEISQQHINITYFKCTLGGRKGK
jgi:hypothetical protein